MCTYDWLGMYDCKRLHVITINTHVYTEISAASILISFHETTFKKFITLDIKNIYISW